MPRGAPLTALLSLTLFAGALLAGCLGGPGPDPLLGAQDEQAGDLVGPYAVIAVVDTGINPYHEAFRDDSPRAFAHPSTYLPDYPEDAIALNITFDHPDIHTALKADCAVWEQVEPGTLYWFPGTRIVGAYAAPGDWEDIPHQDTSRGPITCDDAERAVFGNIFGSNPHGTLVTSRAAANGFGACEECLIVAVQGIGPHPVTWVAEQPWIDLSNHSWGPQAPLFQPNGMPWPRMFADPELVRAVEQAAQEQTAIYASGNGVLFRYGTLGHPTQAAPHLGPSALRVGAHDNAQVTLWHGSSPHIVADACGGWTAEHESMSQAGPLPSGGTSLAAPYAAGIAGKILIEARTILGHNMTGVRDGVLAEGKPTTQGPLSDGVLTKEEFERILMLTATPAPQEHEHDGEVCDPTQNDPLQNPVYAIIPALPVAWSEVPEPAGIPIIGYGAVTQDTLEHAITVLRGEAPLPERDDVDAYLEADRALREAMYTAYTSAP